MPVHLFWTPPHSLFDPAQEVLFGDFLLFPEVLETLYACWGHYRQSFSFVHILLRTRRGFTLRWSCPLSFSQSWSRPRSSALEVHLRLPLSSLIFLCKSFSFAWELWIWRCICQVLEISWSTVDQFMRYRSLTRTEHIESKGLLTMYFLLEKLWFGLTLHLLQEFLPLC